MTKVSQVSHVESERIKMRSFSLKEQEVQFQLIPPKKHIHEAPVSDIQMKLMKNQRTRAQSIPFIADTPLIPKNITKLHLDSIHELEDQEADKKPETSAFGNYKLAEKTEVKLSISSKGLGRLRKILRAQTPLWLLDLRLSNPVDGMQIYELRSDPNMHSLLTPNGIKIAATSINIEKNVIMRNQTVNQAQLEHQIYFFELAAGYEIQVSIPQFQIVIKWQSQQSLEQQMVKENIDLQMLTQTAGFKMANQEFSMERQYNNFTVEISF